MNLRILKRTTVTTTMRNSGSRKYPDIAPYSEETEEETLQFSNDNGITWQDVDVEYEHVERNIE